jgi:signal transduction histidine kinase
MPVTRASIRFLAMLVLLLPGLGLAADETRPTASPSPLRIAIGQTLRPEDENRPAEVEGVVTFVGRQGRTGYLEIGSEAGSMPVTLARGAGHLADLLLRSRVRVRGVCVAVRSSVDGKLVGSMSATNQDDITVLQVPEETWQRYPVCPISATTLTNASGQVLHLRGRIQSVQPGHSFFLTDDTGGVMVGSRQAQPDLAGAELEVLGVAQSRGTNLLFQSGCFRPLTETTNQAALPTLTTTEQIRWLKPDEAKRQYPVKVQGVLTFLRTGGGTLQDATGGIFLWQLGDAAGASEAKLGSFCELEGVTSPGSFSPIILCRKLTVLGEGQFPAAIRPSWDELISGRLDTQWVEVQGVVLSATNFVMELGIKGGRISSQCRVSQRDRLDRYLGAVVRVRGVVQVVHVRGGRSTGVQIDIPGSKFISLEIPAPADPFVAPARHVEELVAYDPGETAFRRVKVTGQIVHQRNNVCYVLDGTNGLRLIVRDGARPGVGAIVEAVGFPEIDSPFDKPLLTLREATIRSVEQSPLPAPIPVGPDDLLNREHDSTLVRVESRLLSVSQYRAEQVLEVQAGSRVFLARLEAAASQMPRLRVGSRLDLVGVYAIRRDPSAPFELLLNSLADVRVLELPSWWTTQHALGVVCAMALVILLALAWIGLLHQQVSKRTAELSAANLSLKGEIAERQRAENELVQMRLRHLVEQERTRIARDLHDDLGSRVTQIVLLLNELALQNGVPAPGAPEHPLEISAAAKEVIQSLDETVWAVNPRNDTLPHLINYLSQFAIEFLKAANVRCRLDFPDHPPARTISAETRHNLFLAVKEALNNSVRHAQATEVRLRMAIDEKSLVLTVEDNGRGFEQAPKHPSADGLRNMRQRMEDIGGQFAIESAPHTGTKVTLASSWAPRE